MVESNTEEILLEYYLCWQGATILDHIGLGIVPTEIHLHDSENTRYNDYKAWFLFV